MSDYYHFEFCFLPNLLFGGKEESLFDSDIRCLDTFENLKIEYEFSTDSNESPFDWDNLIIQKYISKKLNYTVIQFPTPKVAPDALYGIIIEYTDEEPLFFTLEFSENNRYMLCAPHPRGHRNFGNFIEEVTIENFKNTVFKLIERDYKRNV